MRREDFERVRAIYCERYPHLSGIRHGNWERQFSFNACRLAAPEGVSVSDVMHLSHVSLGLESVVD